MRLLIADDSHTMRSILCTYARNLSMETAEAEDGYQALELLEKAGPFDAILIDWDMPRMDGFTLLQRIRSQPQYATMKVLMVTAQNTYDKIAQALAAGSDDYLMKPLDEQMLVEKLCVLGLVD
ncbi:MAG: response regulator [Opitutaceae bacterium]|jgi:two-component system chemotaxis response regulator CheY